MESSGQQRPSDAVAAEVQRWRKARGWSYRDLAMALEQVSMPLTESVLVNLLSRREHEAHGKRVPARGISVDELVGFAKAFNTSVLHLIPRADPASNTFELRFTSPEAFTYFGQHYEEMAVLMERKANQEGA
jgi:transcriptional regulator with XRE-family HTH domain